MTFSRMTMAKEGEFPELLHFVPPLVANHPTIGFDMSLASWLDPTEQLGLCKSYSVSIANNNHIFGKCWSVNIDIQ